MLFYWFAYRTESVNDLGTLIETEGEEEINKAATFIQNKFRTYMSKKKSSTSLDTSLDSPLDNGTNGHQKLEPFWSSESQMDHQMWMDATLIASLHRYGYPVDINIWGHLNLVDLNWIGMSCPPSTATSSSTSSDPSGISFCCLVCVFGAFFLHILLSFLRTSLFSDTRIFIAPPFHGVSSTSKNARRWKYRLDLPFGRPHLTSVNCSL